jgi:tetratricopeptide (TPR) repeat protein
MELNRIMLPPLRGPGEVITFYSFDSASARSVALLTMAQLLAARDNASVPVLMIDWDTASPGLHHDFGQRPARRGLLEYFQACRDHLDLLGRAPAAPDDLALARQVFDAVDWEPYVERVDQSRPLFLMRAGLFDDSYGERADRMDWDGLFMACPALFRHFGMAMASRFAHVLVDAGSGRSASVSICTTLLPRKLVALFTPNPRSLEGLAGVVTRAVDYRCSHEEEQHPLLVYPLPAQVDSFDAERRRRWRRGDPAGTQPGYQALLEQLLRSTYRISHLSLDSYLDEVQLQQAADLSGARILPEVQREGDRFSLARTLATLLDWVDGGHFPWQSHAEVGLLKAVAAARQQLPDDAAGTGASVTLARELHRLGALYREQGGAQQALACFEECLHLRQRLLGQDHADTRATRSELAGLLRSQGKLAEARFLYDLQLDDCVRLLGANHPDTLAARSGLAATLALLGEFDAAMVQHERVNHVCEQRFGPGHAQTLDALAAQAATLARLHELSRARMVYERVLDTRERLLGAEHDDTLACTEQLALVLCELGDLVHARKLQEAVVGARERHAGSAHPRTVAAREALVNILADCDDLDAVSRVQQVLAQVRERSLGAEHPDTLSIQLQLASTLAQRGQLDAARRLQQHVVQRHERLYGADGQETMLSKKMLAATLALQGHSQRATAAPLREQRDILEHRLAELQQLINDRCDAEARTLADALRKVVLRPTVASGLRRRGVAMIKEVYRQHGDTDALLAIMQDEVCWLEGALNEAAGGRPVAAPQ